MIGEQGRPTLSRHSGRNDFFTARGRAGYDKNRDDFNKLIWRNNSPKWAFDDATFDRTAAAFYNPDHVANCDPQLPLAVRSR
jgi:hypothetical protein